MRFRYFVQEEVVRWMLEILDGLGNAAHGKKQQCLLLRSALLAWIYCLREMGQCHKKHQSTSRRTFGVSVCALSRRTDSDNVAEIVGVGRGAKI